MNADRILGCLFGGAVGDAFGGAYEGQSPPVNISNQARWRLSDDTQLTLATCDAIIEQRGAVSPPAVAARFAAWHREGRVTGMGASTYKALLELARGGHWALVGRKGERAAGNGAAMRAAPLAFCLDPHSPEAKRTIRDISRITHHHEEAYAGALAVVVAVRAACVGAWDGSPNLLQTVIAGLPDTQVRDRLAALANLNSELSLTDIGLRFGSSGYVVDSVPLALYGAQQAGRLGFAEMLRQLVMAGGDTDTVASIAGQTAGALIGFQSLPETFLARLPDFDILSRIARQFAAAVRSPQP